MQKGKDKIEQAMVDLAEIITWFIFTSWDSVVLLKSNEKSLWNFDFIGF